MRARPALPWLWFAAAVATMLLAWRGRGQLDICPTIGCDFYTYYAQASHLFEKPAVVEGGFRYPPLSALMFAVFALLPLRGALVFWVLVNIALASFLVVLCADRLRSTFEGAGRWAAATALVGTSLPVAHSIKWGQVSLFVAVAAVVALRNARWQGPALGFLTGLKLFPLGYAFGSVARRDTRAILSTFAWALVCGAVVPLVVLGVETTRAFFGNASGSVTLFGDAPWAGGRSVAFWGGAGLSPALVRWFRDGSHVGLSSDAAPALLAGIPAPAVTALSIVLSFGILGAAYTKLRRLEPASDHAAALCVSAVTLVLQPAWHHYFAFMPYAQAVALSRSRDSRLHSGLVLASWGASALCFVLMWGLPTGYFLYSAWGGTTVSCGLVLAALLTAPGEAVASFSDAPGSSRPSS